MAGGRRAGGDGAGAAAVLRVLRVLLLRSGGEGGGGAGGVKAEAGGACRWEVHRVLRVHRVHRVRPVAAEDPFRWASLDVAEEGVGRRPEMKETVQFTLCFLCFEAVYGETNGNGKSNFVELQLTQHLRRGERHLLYSPSPSASPFPPSLATT